MRKLSFVIIAMIAFGLGTVHAQKKEEITLPSMPVDSITKKITYEGVIEVKGESAETLYNRILAWFNTYYKNPTDVIRENDAAKFRVVGKPRFKVYGAADKTGFQPDGGLVQYTITVASKAGRFKYELTDFNWKQLSYYACERWLDMQSPSFAAVYVNYLESLDAYSKEVIKSLTDAVTTVKPVKNKDDW